MIKPFELKTRAHEAESGEYVLGSHDTGSHACYMIYGTLKPGEQGRSVKPGKGHEEIIMAVIGDLLLSGSFSGMLKEGTALHLAGDDECFLQNMSAAGAVYIIAGGHGEGGHH